MENTRLLLAEDDENLGTLLKEYLGLKGYTTDLYPDGNKAYKGFLKEHYDLCILDVMMPEKDGFTLAQEIRQINSDIPIIFLTAKNIVTSANFFSLLHIEKSVNNLIDSIFFNVTDKYWDNTFAVFYCTSNFLVTWF